jgi:hypothetical protein
MAITAQFSARRKAEGFAPVHPCSMVSYTAANYGIKPKNTDNTLAWNQLIADIRRDGTRGARIKLEPAPYSFRSGLVDTLATTSSYGIDVDGVVGATQFVADGGLLTAGDLITPGRNFHMKGVWLTANGTRAAGTFVKVTGDMLIGDIPSKPLMNIEFADCDMSNGFDGVTLVDGGGGTLGVCGFSWVGRGRIAPVRGFATGGTVFDINTPNGVINTFEKVTHHETSGVADASRVAYTMRIRGSADSRMVSIESVYTKHGLVIDPGATGRAATIWFTNCIWGQCTGTPINIAPNAAADCHSLTFVGGYVDTTTGMTVTGNGAKNIVVKGMTFLGCTTSALSVNTTGPFIGEGLNFAGGNGVCVTLSATARDVKITGQCGNRFAANSVGLNETNGVDRYQVQMVGVTANCTTPRTGTPGATSSVLLY